MVSVGIPRRSMVSLGAEPCHAWPFFQLGTRPLMDEWGGESSTSFEIALVAASSTIYIALGFANTHIVREASTRSQAKRRAVYKTLFQDAGLGNPPLFPASDFMVASTVEI